MNNKRNKRNKEYLRRTNDVSQFEHHTDMNFANLLFFNYIPNKRELIINFKRRCFFFSFGGVITVSGKPCERQIEAPNCKAETLLEHNYEPRWRDIDVQSRCAVRMFERIGQAKLVSRVVYKLAFDRGLEPLSFFLSLSSLPIQSLIVDSR